MVKFRTKSALFVSFLTKIFKNYCHISNQQLRICLIAKFCEETKMLKFATKNVLFEYFWPKMLSLGIFGIELKKNLLSCLKSSPLNLSNCKISWNNENGQIWNQKCFIWVFSYQNLKKLLSYLKSAPSNYCNSKSLWRNNNA